MGKGHDYTVRAIPDDVWERAKKRAHGEQRSIRLILIRALAAYGNGRLTV